MPFLLVSAAAVQENSRPERRLSRSLLRDHDELRRQILESDWYRRIFPGTRIAARGNRQFKISTTRNGYIMAITVGGAVTGRGADFIILDDCMKANDRAGIHRTYVSDIERGARNPTITVVEKLAKPLGVRLGELLD